jgi:hypothetical protein
MSSLISEILATANDRAKEKNLSYQGELLPMEAYTLLAEGAWRAPDRCTNASGVRLRRAHSRQR